MNVARATLIVALLWGMAGAFAGAADSYELRIQKSAGGVIAGDIVGGDGKRLIYCGSAGYQHECSATVKSGARFRLMALPESGWDLGGTWSGCEASPPQSCFVTMNSPKTVSYAFRQKGVVTITITQPRNGVITYKLDRIAGEATCPTQCRPVVTRGDRWRATMQGTLGWIPESWGADCSNQPNPCNLLADQDKSVAANFKLARTYAIIVTKPAHGVIAGDIAGGDGKRLIYCGSAGHQNECDLRVTDGTVLRLFGLPDSGHSFGPWSGACNGSRNQLCTVTVKGPLTVTQTYP